jgi:hypothetical protein
MPYINVGQGLDWILYIIGMLTSLCNERKVESWNYMEQDHLYFSKLREFIRDYSLDLTVYNVMYKP